MKTLVMVAAADAIYLVIVSLIFRFQSINDRAALMARLFVTSTPVFALVYAFTPPDLGFLPATHSLSALNDLPFGLFVYGATIFGGILQLYNLSERGFSMRILIDILSDPRGRRTEDEIARDYGAGRGIDWMFQKRIDNLIESRMIRVESGRAYATPRGRFVGGVYRRLKAFLRLSADGE